MAQYTYAFTGIGNPSTVRRSDGLEFPQDPGLSEYQQWLAYTAAGGITTPPVAVALEEHKDRANKVVNGRAAAARRAAQHLPVPEDLGNMLRYAEAEDSLRDPSPDEANYPLLVAEKPWNGGTLEGVTAAVYSESYGLRTALAFVEHTRRVALQGIADATTLEGVLDVLAQLSFAGPLTLTPGAAVLHLRPNAETLGKGTKTLTPSVQTLTLTPNAPTIDQAPSEGPGGIAVDHDGNPEAGAFWLSNNFLDPLTHSFVIGGWVSIDGRAGDDGNDQGHVVFAIPRDSASYDNSSGFILYCASSKGSTPYDMIGEVSNNATWNQVPIGPFETGTPYYVVLVWDAVAMNATWYWKADGESSLQSGTAGSAITSFGGGSMDGVWYGTDNVGVIPRGSHLTLKKWREWRMAGAPTLDATALLAESESATPVITANLHAVYDMDGASDLADSSGNGRNLTAIGSISTGVLDPVDLH